jgi:hypothetical protein
VLATGIKVIGHGELLQEMASGRMPRQATKPLVPELASLFVPMPGPAWQVHPRNEVEVCRIVHVGEIKQAGYFRFPRYPDGRYNLAEFILTGQTIIGARA